MSENGEIFLRSNKFGAVPSSPVLYNTSLATISSSHECNFEGNDLSIDSDGMLFGNYGYGNSDGQETQLVLENVTQIKYTKKYSTSLNRRTRKNEMEHEMKEGMGNIRHTRNNRNMNRRMKRKKNCSILQCRFCAVADDIENVTD